MARRYLIVSDLHLCDFEAHDDGWMAHKHPRYDFDQGFADLVEHFCRRAACSERGEDDELVLILNGDILDFDLLTAVPDPPPWPVRSSERHRGLVSSAEKSAWKAQRIVDAHPRFIQALARFLDQGHELVYVLGNHDRELHYPQVSALIASAIEAQREPAKPGTKRSELRFEPWFYHFPGQLYAEHGQQYSYYTSFNDPLCPTIDSAEGPVLALPMGNLSNRYLMTKMGFFNPFASDFILNVFAYFWHWLRFYAFSRRSLAFSWFWGSLVVMIRLLSIKKAQLGQSASCPLQLQQQAEHHRLEVDALKALLALQQAPITNRFFRVMREFWIDRLLLSLLMVGGTISLALVPIPLWIKLMIPLTVFPLVFVIYEALAHGDTIFAIEGEMPRVSREIAKILKVPVVAMGHDHVPRLLPLSRDVLFADTGTWAPIYDPKTGALSPGFRNYLELRFEGNELCDLRFGSYVGEAEAAASTR
ncbi:MAG: metallophosphoesterase [Myxococcota bacterium]|nr:metallophosphoesterase [Myxococcota bacterium]